MITVNVSRSESFLSLPSPWGLDLQRLASVASTESDHSSSIERRRPLYKVSSATSDADSKFFFRHFHERRRRHDEACSAPDRHQREVEVHQLQPDSEQQVVVRAPKFDTECWYDKSNGTAKRLNCCVLETSVVGRLGDMGFAEFEFGDFTWMSDVPNLEISHSRAHSCAETGGFHEAVRGLLVLDQPERKRNDSTADHTIPRCLYTYVKGHPDCKLKCFYSWASRSPNTFVESVAMSPSLRRTILATSHTNHQDRKSVV